MLLIALTIPKVRKKLSMSTSTEVWTVWWGVDGRAGAVVKGGKAMDVKVYGLPR